MTCDVIRRVGGAMVFALVVVFSGVALLTVPTPAHAQTPPDYGFTWSTITHPGNRDANIDEAPYLYPPFSTPATPIGGVDHEYRITTTEVSVSQWFEFVQAYRPYYTGSPHDLAFTGFWIRYDSTAGNYFIREGAANRPSGMSWRFAARYVNWLENDKRLDQAAFENGAYDTSTFFTNPDGTITDQREHSAGSRFWIPTLDELTKATFYDPNRYGVGMEGYWVQPNGTDTPLIPGYPEEGGQTAAGLEPNAPNAHWLDIGSYPDVRTPWGLLDASGGVGEWAEDVFNMRDRGDRGSAQYDGSPDYRDRLDVYGANSPNHAPFIGIRIASVVPSLGTFPALTFGLWTLLRRRRTHGT